MDPRKTIFQKILLGSIYTLLLLMIFFSLQAKQNIGQQGYDQCHQKKCELAGEAFCNKFREISNCCLGADGKVGIVGSEYGCVFEE